MPSLEGKQLSTADGCISDASFHPDSDDRAAESSASTDITIPDTRPAKAPVSSSSRSQRATCNPQNPERLPDFSDDPNDDTDEDLTNVPLDYGRSVKTKRRGIRIEQRWHK